MSEALRQKSAKKDYIPNCIKVKLQAKNQSLLLQAPLGAEAGLLRPKFGGGGGARQGLA